MSLQSKFDVVVNCKSGTVLGAGQDVVRQHLLDGFGERIGDIQFIEPQDIKASVSDWASKDQSERNDLIIGGGDGTVLSAVMQVMDQDVSLGVLPLGTQNFVSRHLGFSPDYREAAKQYMTVDSEDCRVVPMGNVNGHPFLCGLAVNQSTVALFDAREHMRDGHYFSALRSAFSAAVGLLFGRPLPITVVAGQGLERHEVTAHGRSLVIVPGQYKPEQPDLEDLKTGGLKQVFARMLARDENETPDLTAYIFKGGVSALFHFIPSAFLGCWNKHRDVTTVKSEHLQLDIDRASYKDRAVLPIIVDGEIEMTSFPLDITIIPDAVKMFHP